MGKIINFKETKDERYNQLKGIIRFKIKKVSKKNIVNVK